jgi:protein LTV1
MMSDFLENYEILGAKMKPRLQGNSGVEKLDTLRKALGHDGHVAENNEESEEEGDLLPTDDVDERDRWDCETILSKCPRSLYFVLNYTARLMQPHTPISKIILV